MDTNLYTLIIISSIVIIAIIILGVGMISGQMATFYRLSEQSRMKAKEADEKQSAFLRHMHIESKKDSRESKRLLAELKENTTELRQINKDNAIYLRMIFERVDKPEELEG